MTKRHLVRSLLTGLLSSLFALIPISNLHADEQSEWVDKTFQELSEEQRIAQLFMVAAYSKQDDRHYKELEELIKRYNVGGLIFFKSDCETQIKLTNHYQAVAKTPLLISLDAEWGLGMRLQDGMCFPKQMTLGAIQDDKLIYDMGSEIARQLRRIGVHINFAPVLDINSNPDNPVIGRRSFGDNKERVATKGIAYLKGLQTSGVLAVAKHFPGHGDTSKDSHKTLPVIPYDRKRIDAVELFPFKKAIAAGVGGIMTAHLHVPAYDDAPNQSASLSKKIVTDLLKKELGYSGFVFTDALNMKGVSEYHAPGEVDLLALQAGNDILVFSEDVPKGIALIQKAMKEGTVDPEQVDNTVKRILAFKYQMGLHRWKPIEDKNLAADLNSPQAKHLKQQLFEQSITVVINKDNLIPLKKLGQQKIASLSIISESMAKQGGSDTAISDASAQGDSRAQLFPSMLDKYAPVSHYTLVRESITKEAVEQLAKQLRRYSVVIVDIHSISGRRSEGFGLTAEELKLLSDLEEETNLIVVPFGSVYSLERFKNHQHVIMPYEDDPVAIKVVPQIIFGALSAQGKLPVSIPGAWQSGTGIRTEKLPRLGYAQPEAVRMDSCVLQEIDAIVEKAIAQHATPGCQILVARKGKVVLEKNYGHLTYAKNHLVTPYTLYDLASVTKVAGTLQAIMHLVSQGKLDVKKNLSFYLPALKGTNKGKLKIADILAHQAGLKASAIREIMQALKNKDDRLRQVLFSTTQSTTYSYRLAPALYGTSWFHAMVWDCCVNSSLRPKPCFRKYDCKYSCLGFFLLKRLAETLLKEPLDSFLTEELYKPLGLTTLTYCPLDKFPINRIAPTEEDNTFRQSLLQGLVHDEKAALYGGLAGNAGLFGNANDLAILLQMHLQNGYYGNKRYFQKGIVQQFTQSVSRKNHRGLGWDKPVGVEWSYVSAQASTDAYGHSGFTGTVVWVDPKYDLIFIFLSNRVHPQRSNVELIRQKVRARVQDVVYKALLDRK
ncbi:MAG: glycoside hydrolase family 3 N-terminal domain-containing protein [Bacteroidota bacterium]